MQPGTSTRRHTTHYCDGMFIFAIICILLAVIASSWPVQRPRAGGVSGPVEAPSVAGNDDLARGAVVRLVCSCSVPC